MMRMARAMATLVLVEGSDVALASFLFGLRTWA
jgi:hypothetical protein